jgi:hypothetical protein
MGYRVGDMVGRKKIEYRWEEKVGYRNLREIE